MPYRAVFVLAALAVVGGACGSSPGQPPDAAGAGDAAADPDAADPPPAKACASVPALGYTGGEKTFRETCVACHTIGGGDHRAPDLRDVHTRRTRQWMMQWMMDPAGMATTDPTARDLVAAWGYLMPDFGFTGPTGRAVLDYMAAVNDVGVTPRAPMALSEAQFAETRQLYFDRCAGCHGTYRAGATGPDIGRARAQGMGTDSIVATLHWGTPRGMPAWGHEGLLDAAEIECMAAYLQLEPPAAPPRSLAEIRASWELLVPPGERPTAPAHGRDWQDFFAVILRDPGQVAIFDGATKEEVARIDAGHSLHVVRTSSTGRYLYAVGRDGRVTMIDLWTATPQAVARVQGCYDSRSVESSKLAGWEDRYVVQGCYWPAQYVVYDGLTLEPLGRNDVPLTAVDTGETLREVRTAAVVASPFAPVWLLAFKESGYIGFVDYSQPGFPLVTQLPALRYLHDGGWDHTRRWFLVAANASDRIVVVDAQQRTIAAQIATGDTPHPGRGANWQDPEYGWVNATTHIGEGKLTVYGADPVGHPEHAWTVVREVPLPAAGGLFLKTHPASPWVLLDMPLASDPSAARQICAYAKATGTLDRCFTPAPAGRAVHFEFDRDGAEVWVSVWAEQGELVIYDAITLEERRRIGPLETPTGKFNVHNTTHDVY